MSEYLQASSSSGYATSSSAKGAVEIYETDGEGKFIKLYNTSDKVRVECSITKKERNSIFFSLLE